MRGLLTATDAGRTHVRRRRVEIAVGLAALLVVVSWFLARASAVVSMGVAVAAAFAWCFWLEHHPENVHGHSLQTPRAGHPSVKAVLRFRTRGAASWYFHPW